MMELSLVVARQACLLPSRQPKEDRKYFFWSGMTALAKSC
jgi:hypothetical protein